MGFNDQAFPVSLLKSINFAFKHLVIKIWYGVGPSLWIVVDEFRQSGVPCSAVEKCHPHLQVPGRQNLRLLSAGCYEGPSVELPGPLVKLGLVSLFNSNPFTMRVCNAV
jgi:hypothetical protein